MSTKNVTLHDENGNVLLPATKTSRVTDASGTNLDTLLQQAGQVKSISVNGTAQTIDANGNVDIDAVTDDMIKNVAYFGDTVGNATIDNGNDEADSSLLEKFKNKKIAVIGDSISTFQGWLPSDITGYDGETYATYYKPYGSGDVNSPMKTWWYQMMQLLGLPVSGDTINVCAWSGSRVTGDSASTTSASAACSTRRISDLSIRGWNPNIIIIFISCNDWGNNIPLGDWKVSDAIPSDGTISAARAGYALMLNKIHISYPKARIFCCTILDDYRRDSTSGWPSNNSSGVTTYQWNQNIKEIAGAFGCDIIDLHSCGVNYSNIASMAVDSGLHPNAEAMTMMAQKAASELIAKY